MELAFLQLGADVKLDKTKIIGEVGTKYIFNKDKKNNFGYCFLI